MQLFFFPQRDLNEPALASKMFQAINDGDVDALKEILTEQGTQLNNIKTVSIKLFCVKRCSLRPLAKHISHRKRHLLSLFRFSRARCVNLVLVLCA